MEHLKAFLLGAVFFGLVTEVVLDGGCPDVPACTAACKAKNANTISGRCDGNDRCFCLIPWKGCRNLGTSSGCPKKPKKCATACRNIFGQKLMSSSCVQGVSGKNDVCQCKYSPGSSEIRLSNVAPVNNRATSTTEQIATSWYTSTLRQTSINFVTTEPISTTATTTNSSRSTYNGLHNTSSTYSTDPISQSANITTTPAPSTEGTTWPRSETTSPSDTSTTRTTSRPETTTTDDCTCTC